MKALTLWPEWAHAIAWLGKDIENRTWEPRLKVGEEFLIHAGAHIGGRAGRVASQEGIDALGYTAEHAGLEVAAGHCPSDHAEVNFMAHDYARRIQRRAIVARVRFLGTVTESDSPWFVGPIGWRIELTRNLDPVIPYQKGALGLWALRLPESALGESR